MPSSGNPLEPFLTSQGFVVLDGGLATTLEAWGHDLSTALWSARLLEDEPDQIRKAHTAHLRAGADCITTASYQATVRGFVASGLERRRAERLIGDSVRLAREARDSYWASHDRSAARLRPLVAASVGPYGAYLADGSEYRGEYGIDRGALIDFHLERLEILTGAGPDLLAFETIPSLEEAEVLLELLDALPGWWAWLSFSCRDDRSVSDGAPFAEAVRACRSHARLAAVGVNCTAPAFVPGLLASVQESGGPTLLAYPNSGESYDARTKRWSGDASPEAWGEAVSTWWAAGARVIGGCCRVGPEDIGVLRGRVEAEHDRSAESTRASGSAALPDAPAVGA